MNALSFNEALAKYREDQLRDERGRFAIEGGGKDTHGKWVKVTGREAQDVFKRNYKPMTYAQFIATLTPEQRKDMVGQAKKVYTAQKDAQDKLTKNYKGLAKNYGITPKNIQYDPYAEFDEPVNAADIVRQTRVTPKKGGG